jgi:putative lipoic acid-binding regulatory protein
VSLDVTTPPKITFPCRDYPIKVLGEAVEEFRESVLAVLANHAEFSSDHAPIKPSSKGRFVSLTVYIIATSEVQLKALHTELIGLSFVKMVL